MDAQRRNLTDDDVSGVIEAATRAPSSHNSQPWRFEVTDHGIELYADLERRLPVNDPMDRELLISCGAALANLEVASAHIGSIAQVVIMPDPDDTDHVASISFEPGSTVGEDLFDMIEVRRTVRGRFDGTPIDDVALHGLVGAGRQFGVEIHLVDLDHRDEFADLVAQADAAQFGTDDWRSELADWMRAPGADDGLPVAPMLGGLVRLIVAHFDVGAPMAERDARLVREAPLLLILSTERDDRADWLGMGRALEWLLLTATSRDLSVGFLNQVCQVPEVRAQVRSTFTPGRQPQVALRLGRGAQPVVRSKRRPIDDVETTPPT